jgi:hypothetical protein
MPGSTLPTKAEFFANHLEAIDTCGICHETFDKDHVATRIRGAKCQHIFGSTCLTTWLNCNRGQNNTCPNGREVLFVKPCPIATPRPRLPRPPIPPPPITVVTATSPSSYRNRLDEVTDSNLAWWFVQDLWTHGQEISRECGARGIHQLSESRLEETIYAVTHAAASNKWKGKYPTGLCVKMEDMPALKSILKEMILYLPPKADFSTIVEHKHLQFVRWFDMLKAALRWRLEQ